MKTSSASFVAKTVNKPSLEDAGTLLASMTHLILSPIFPPNRFGGIERIVESLAIGMANRDRVKVVAFDPTGRSGLDILRGLEVMRVPCPSSTSNVHSMLNSQDDVVAASMTSLTKKSNVIVHVHDWFMGPAAIRLKHVLDAPLVVTFHSDKRSEYGANLDEERNRVHQLQRELCHASDLVYCYSDFMKHSIAASLDISAGRIHTFRCGLEPDVVPRPGGFRSDPPNVLYLGRVAPEKDVPTLVRAFARVVDRLPGCRLRIVGSGSRESEVRQVAKTLGLIDSIDFMPFTSSSSAVDAEIRSASVLVLPSVFEPFGLVVLEAAARGVPVIVPNFGGPAEIVRDDSLGLRFTPSDDVALADKILDCLISPDAAEARASALIADARRRYRWAVAVEGIRRRCAGLLKKRMNSREI